MSKQPIHAHYKRMLWCLVALALLLAACGEGVTTSSRSAPSSDAAMAPAQQKQQAAGRSSSSNQQPGKSQGKNTTNFIGPQYLIKSLNVTMDVKDTKKAADELQSWINTADPRSTSAGTEYREVGANLFNISLKFSVQATAYPQIYRYLRDYASNIGGRLQSFSESVQDVTNDYVDTQARLKNLRAEQDRLLQLLGQAKNLDETLTLENKLTAVASDIDSYQARLNTLASQTTFYTISLVLQPIGTATPLPTQPGWNIGQVFSDAFTASLALGQGLLSFLIWLLAFSVYIIPVVLIAWFLIRSRQRIQRIRHTSPIAAPPPPVAKG